MTNFASQLRANLGVKDGTIPKERAANAYSVADMALQYQPVVATDTGTLAGLEALVRWRDPVKGLLAAGEFIHGLSKMDGPCRVRTGNAVQGRRDARQIVRKR